MAGGKALFNFSRMRPGVGIHAWLCIRNGSAMRMRRAMSMTVRRPASVIVIVIVIVAVAVAELMRMIVAFFMAVHMVAVNTISTMLVSMPVVMAMVMGLRQTL